MLLFFSVLTGCGGYEDSPYPMSQNNLQTLSDKLLSNVKAYTRSPNDSDIQVFRDVYQATLQDDLGYSFDKTVRAILVFGYGGRAAVDVLSPVLKYIINDKASALEEDIISKRTFELISLPQNNMNKGDMQFLQYIIACQENNNDECTSKGLIEIIEAKNTDQKISKIFEKYDIDSSDLKSELAYKFDFNIPSGNFITKPDGSRFNTNFIFSSSDPFYVDKTNLECFLLPYILIAQYRQVVEHSCLFVVLLIKSINLPTANLSSLSPWWC